MGTRDLSSDTNSRRILLIGDINRAFLDADAVHRLPCEIQTNMPDAIEMAARGNFAAIAVVMSGMSGKLSSALKRLREANRDAKIILLAQMYEEPLAMQLVGSASNGPGDDYLICPIHFSYLVSRISYLERATPTQGWQVVGTAGPVTVDEVAEMRIKQLEKLATEDELTGLKNRRYIWEFSRQVIEHARGEDGKVTLLIFDIDNFKHYNDVYGHLAGDEVLKQAAVLMQRCCRGHDVVGRIGGDEFAVVFWDRQNTEYRIQKSEVRKQKTENRRQTLVDHPKEAIFIAKRFRKELGKAELHLLGPEGKGVLAISGGLASFPRDGPTIQELFQQADKALLEAKRSGKNRIYLVGKPQNDIADLGG
ncbi:MAG: diguanylate cyclase [Planctomycetota bacterium]|jgi:two-component system chemotaxis family response regulator WspR